MRVLLDGDDESESDETILIDAPETPARTCRVFVPPTDIDTCVRFSVSRMLMSFLILLLALTDIPRTGLGLSSLSDYYNVVGLDTVMYFGPYAYPVAHFYVTPTNSSDPDMYSATTDGERIESVDVWAYKFDSLSIPTRALAQHLNVSTYPRCLQSAQPCPSSVLSLRTAFRMLDELIAAFTATRASASLVFVTTSLWIDRLHQFLVKSIRKNVERRTHVVQHFSASSPQLQTHVCDPLAYVGAGSTSTAMPLICDVPQHWVCDHPDTTASPPQVPLPNHIALRVAALRMQYPGLEFDLTMITSRLVIWTRHWTYLPAVSYAADTLEVTTFVRGRACTHATPATAVGANERTCRTVFIDDYRYERATFISDADQWFDVASGLRAAGQTFVWLRFTLLWIGCYCARTAEQKFARASLSTKVYYTVLTITKIPSHVVVYGSWFPICCYVLAHYLDSALIHLICNTVWSTVNGVVSFEPIKYVRIASIQMRNIWLVALFAKIVVNARQYGSRPRQDRWTVRDGIVGTRAIVFGMVSSLTVFSCLRARPFRDSSILEITVLADHGPLHGDLAFGTSNDTLYGIRFDFVTLSLAACVVLATFPLAHVASVLLHRGDACLALTCHSYYVPHSVDSMWPRGSLLTHWRMALVESAASPPVRALSQRGDALRYSPDKSSLSNQPSRQLVTRWCCTSAVFPAPAPQPQRALSSAGTTRVCTVSCRFKQTRHTWWHAVQGCPHHDSLVDVLARRKRHWSAVRIINIAMMTDPIVLIQLYTIGHKMIIYRAKSQAAAVGAVSCMPARLATGAQQQQLQQCQSDDAIAQDLELECDGSREPAAPTIADVEALRLPTTTMTTSSSSDNNITNNNSNNNNNARLFIGPPYVMGESERTMKRVSEHYLRDYELVGSTNSALLPWTVLVNSG